MRLIELTDAYSTPGASTMNRLLSVPKTALQRCRLLGCACLAIVFFMQQANASVTLDFNTLPGGGAIEHGRIINSQYFASDGVTISGVNRGGGPDLVVAFDTSKTGTRDRDLEDPFTGGNIPSNTFLGNVLIIQENNWGSSDGVVNYPDDEGTRPAGSIFFDFDDPITEISFDLLDVEGPDEFGDSAGYVASFFDGSGVELARVGFGEFITSSSLFYDSTVEYGNNSANRIQPITAANLSELTGDVIENFSRVEINFGGSAAIDNLVYTSFISPNQVIPEASSVLIWALLGLTVGGCKRRQLHRGRG